MTSSATNNAIRQIIPHNVPLIFAKISPLEIWSMVKFDRFNEGIPPKGLEIYVGCVIENNDLVVSPP